MKKIAVLLALPLVGVMTGVAGASGFSLSSAHLGAASASSPVMFPVSVTLGHAGNGRSGTPQNGDSITLVWSQPIDESSLCSSWSNTTPARSVQLQWSIIAGSGKADDTLAVTGTSPACATGFHVGSIDLGANGYNQDPHHPIDFPTSNNVLSVGATTTLTVTLNGETQGKAGTVKKGNPAVWSPDPMLQDLSGHTCDANLAETTATVQF